MDDSLANVSAHTCTHTKTYRTEWGEKCHDCPTYLYVWLNEQCRNCGEYGQVPYICPVNLQPHLRF